MFYLALICMRYWYAGNSSHRLYSMTAPSTVRYLSVRSGGVADWCATTLYAICRRTRLLNYLKIISHGMSYHKSQNHTINS